MLIIAVNMNIQFNNYITLKEHTDVYDPQDRGETHRVQKMCVHWFAVFVLFFMACAGVTVMRAIPSGMNGVNAELLGQFYAIAGACFLFLTVAFAIVLGLKIMNLSSTVKPFFAQHKGAILGSAALLTLPVLARSIFDLCVGTNKDIR